MGLLDRFRKRNATSKRRYDGSAVGRLFADFMVSQKSADANIRHDLVTLRNRSRDLSRNNEYCKRYFRTLRQNVVGDRGVTLQVKALGLDGRLDMSGNDIIETAWKNWTKAENCTVTGTMTFRDCQNVFIESLARDGEVLLRKVRYNNDHGFAIQFLEPDHLDEKKNERLPNGNFIRMGVEMDRFRKPVAYHILTEHPGDIEYASAVRRTERVPADSIIHVYDPDRAEQTRGVPWTSVAISALQMLHGYREAELVAARTAASKMGFFTSPTGDGFAPDDLEDSVVPIMEAEPGTLHQLPQGVNFVPWDPAHPTSAFEAFERSILRGIASGLGISYHTLANDLTMTSYSSIRQGALEDRDFYRGLQRMMIEHFVMPIYAEWLNSAMTYGSVVIPLRRFDKFYDASSFQPRGFSWVDPQKEISAHVTALQNGLISMQDVQNNYGRDVEETFSQIARDKQMAEEFGLTLAFEPFGATKLPILPMTNEETGEQVVAQPTAVASPQSAVVDQPSPQAEDQGIQAPDKLMNGAQVASIIEVVTAFGQGVISEESAIEILIVGFGVNEEKAKKIVGGGQ